MSSLTSPAILRNRLKLRQLNLLAAIGEMGSLHKAADKIGVSQPAATRLLHELEALFCIPLFKRTNRGLIPTETGRLLVRHASVLVAGIDNVYEATRSVRQGTAGSLRIGVATGVRPDLVPQAVLLLKKATPGVDLHVQEGGQADLLMGLKSGQHDLVVGRAPSSEDAEGVVFEALYDEKFSAVCGVKNRVARPSRTQPLQTLVDQRWIMPPPSTALRKTLDNQFIAQCGRLPADVIDSVSVMSVLAMIEAAPLIALLPQRIAQYYAKRRLLCILVTAMPHLAGTLGTITSGEGRQLPTVIRLAEALRQLCRQPSSSRDTKS